MRVEDQVVVSAEQMRQIEARIFEAGLPVAALMEKAAGLAAARIQILYPLDKAPRVGVLVGPGHNGGDALVVARELHLKGYQVALWSPFEQHQDLTLSHLKYATILGIPTIGEIAMMALPDVWVDGLFGIGLTRPIAGRIAQGIDWVNRSNRPVVAIDLPSGVNSDSGEVQTTAIRATQTLAIGLWKCAHLADFALEQLGDVERLDIGIPASDIDAVLGEEPILRRITAAQARAHLPLPISPIAHKYRRGHLLLIAGSYRYKGAAILAGLGARASGVGMLSIVVPASMEALVSNQLPDAIVIGCEENEHGAIDGIPEELNMDRYDTIVCGPGISLAAAHLVEQVYKLQRPMLLDADALNLIAKRDVSQKLQRRKTTTVLTPHPGEFERLFPDIVDAGGPAHHLAQQAADRCGAIVLIKGARTIIAHPEGPVWFNPDSTPALARGGSGDVLSGLMGGLMAIAAAQQQDISAAVQTAVWWHSQAARQIVAERTELGLDAQTLAEQLIPCLRSLLD
jgi:ADP-dependent NAD(P)H-hydrate dehydratase / NAD(P)H-hydrate epimerase